jgi:CotH protein.
MYGKGYTTGLWTSSDPEVEVRLRGNSTRNLPKHPYRIKFPEKTSPLGLNHANEKSWTLLANDCDKTLLRNVIAFSWSRALFKKSDHDNNAIMFTPASRHVNLFLNKQYVGLYQMSDHMERADGRIELESLKASDEGNATKITGGYLLETDVHGSSEPFHFISNKNVKITHKYPADDDHATEQYTYIKNHLNTAEAVLFGSNFKDPVNGWRKYWDEKTAVDFMIVKELTWDPDGFTSIYFYKRRGDDRFFFGPVWDFDKAYNNDKRKLDLYLDLMIHKSFPTNGSGTHWHARMWDDETFRAAVKARWNSKKTELLAASNKVFQEEPEKMAKSIKANFTRWNITDQALLDAATPPSSYDEGLGWLKDYVQSRYEFLDRKFNE